MVAVADDATTTKVGHAGVLQTLRETPLAARFALLGVFVNQFGAFLQFFVVLYLTQRGFSGGEAGVALGVYSAGAIAGVLLGGTLTDRLGPRWTIVLSVGSAALFTLSVTALDSLAAIVVAVALSGAMSQAARPAVSALLFSLVPRARQVMVFAMYRTALNAGIILGPLVAVWLSTISWDLVFYFDAGCALTYCAIAAFLLPRGRVAADSESTVAAGPAADDAAPATSTAAAADAAAEDSPAPAKVSGYGTLLRDGKYLGYLSLMLGNGLVHVQFFAVLPLMLVAGGYPTWVYGSLTAISAFIVVSGELLVTKTTQKWAAWTATITGWVLLVIGRGAFGLPGGLTLLIAATAIAAIGQIIGGAQAFAYPAKVAPPGAVGRYLGSAHAMFGLGYAVGPVIGVLLWTNIGNAFWGICFALGVVLVLPGIWGMRQPPEAAAEPAPAERDSGDHGPVVAETDRSAATSP